MAEGEETAALPGGTRLDRYQVVEHLGGGGFSQVYLALDPAGEAVVLKEYLPRRLAHRDASGQVVPRGEEEAARLQRGRALFFQEAAALAQLDHPGIVRVLGFFRALGTVYLVMEHVPGISLERRIGDGARFDQAGLLEVFVPVLEALEYLHGLGFLHLDLKPANILIRVDGRPVIIDFGAVHRQAVTRQHQAEQVTTPGFAPIEQYTRSGYIGPWSDVYAVGASIRACIEGRPPVDARRRHPEDPLRPLRSLAGERFSAPFLKTVDWAMEAEPVARPQDAGALRMALQSAAPPDPRPGLMQRVGAVLNRARQ